MSSTSFYTEQELAQLGLKQYGKNVLISKKVSIYGAQNMVIGDNVRIDDFSILSGHISLGSNIHIAAFCALYGGTAGISMEDYSGLSARVTIYAETDDFGGEYMVGSMAPTDKRRLIRGEVKICRYVQIGANCVILPNLTVGEGASVGALSLIIRSIEGWHIYKGIPVHVLRKRSKGLLKFVPPNNE